MGFLCGSTLEVVGEGFLKISYSRWERVFESVFGTICGVGSYLSRKRFQYCITYQGIRMCLWCSICVGKMGLCTGMRFLLD